MVTCRTLKRQCVENADVNSRVLKSGRSPHCIECNASKRGCSLSSDVDARTARKSSNLLNGPFFGRDLRLPETDTIWDTHGRF
jgi:hypothetical protein